MIDLHLKFDTEAEAAAVLYTALPAEIRIEKMVNATVYLMQGEIDEDGDRENYTTTDAPKKGDVVLDSWNEDRPEFSYETQTQLVPNYANIDTIGLIYKPTGTTLTDGEGNEYPEMAAISGWHVNVRLMNGEDAEPLEAYRVQVANPMRVWA